MSSRSFTDYNGSGEPATEQDEPTRVETETTLPVVERERSGRSRCPDCAGRIVAARFDSYCEACGLVVSECHLDHGPTLADIGKGANQGGRPRLETDSRYHADPVGSTFPPRWRLRRDGRGNRLSASQRRRMTRLVRRFRWERDSRDVLLTDALKDIRSIGRNAGLPVFVRERATELFRHALDAGLAGGRMAYESLAVGAVVVAAREAGCPQSIDAITPWGRTPEERACAGARKVRLGLGLTETCPPVRPEAVDVVLDALEADGESDRLGSEYLRVRTVASHLLAMADEVAIGPGTPRLTVAAAAVYAATKLLGQGRVTQGELAEAVEPIVETTAGRLSRYNCLLIDAYVDRYGSDDPGVVLERGAIRLR